MYVHNVSPLKRSSDGGQYFEYMAQTANGAKKALCFHSETKRPRICEAQASRSPIKIANFNTSQGKIFMNQQSTVMVLEPGDANFQFNPALSENAIVELKDLPKLATGQFVNIKVEVTKLSEISKHQTYGGHKIDKQTIQVRDSSSNVNIILYGGDCNSVEISKCYVLKNLRLRLVKNCPILNTSTSYQFKAELIDPIKNLVALEEPNCETTIVGVVCGVETIKTFAICPKCLKKNVVVDDLKCEKCRMILNTMHCATTYFLALNIKEISTGEIYQLNFPSDRVKDLIKVIEYPSLFTNKSSEDEFVKHLFNITEPFTITFIAGPNTVKNIKLSVKS